MTKKEINIELLGSGEKNAVFVLELLKNQDYRIAGMPMSPNAENVKAMLAGNKILAMGIRDGSNMIYFGIAVPSILDEANEFGLYGVLFDKNMTRERPEISPQSILCLRDYLFCQKMSKVGILLPQSPETADVLTRIRRQGFKQESVWRSYFKTSAGFVDGVLLDITADDRRIRVAVMAPVLSGLVPDKEKVREALELLPWLGLTQKQGILLATVLQNPGKMHIDLASMADIDRAYVSEICSLLSEKGFIMQIDDEKDCRIKHVYPLPEMIIRQENEAKNVLPQKKLTATEIQHLKEAFVEKLKKLEIKFRPQRMSKMLVAIEILADRRGEIVTTEVLAKDLKCTDQSARDAIGVLVKTGMATSSFKGIAGKATKVVGLILEEAAEEVPEAAIRPEAVIEKKVVAAPLENKPAIVSAKPVISILVESIVEKVEPEVKREIPREKARVFADTVDTVCAKYGFGDTQRTILDGLINAPGRLLKMDEIKKLKGLEKLSINNLKSYLADMRNQKVIEIQNKVIILRI
jgi:DNA-binding MarR family transcriptional regulator